MKKLAVILISPLLVFVAWAATAEKEPASVGHKIMLAKELAWADAPPALPPGAKIAILDGDPNKPGAFTTRLKTPAGYKVMPHTHPTPERITVISGSFHMGMGEKFDETAGRAIDVGGFVVMPAGMAHYAWTTSETIIQVNSEGPFQINYINAADDPRGAKK